MLEITDLTHSYGPPGAGHLAIDRITLTVDDGELVSIVGPSGCGKSTLLRCVAGLLSPAGGSVVLGGAPVDRVPDGLALVFQDYSRSLLPWLSVRDNVALPLRRKPPGRRPGRQPGRAARREAAIAALATVGLTGTAQKYPWQLSGGMQQRVAIARALACEPALLLMDEPFGSVDAQTREDLEDLILAVRRERDITILLVTHDVDQIRADLPVDLPSPRDQITTRELAAFVHLRTQVSRMVRASSLDRSP
jgi:NitT/TauT family transport system ATP-binding protein